MVGANLHRIIGGQLQPVCLYYSQWFLRLQKLKPLLRGLTARELPRRVLNMIH